MKTAPVIPAAKSSSEEAGTPSEGVVAFAPVPLAETPPSNGLVPRTRAYSVMRRSTNAAGRSKVTVTWFEPGDAPAMFEAYQIAWLMPLPRNVAMAW